MYQLSKTISESDFYHMPKRFLHIMDSLNSETEGMCLNAYGSQKNSQNEWIKNVIDAKKFFNEMGEILPGWFHFNSLDDFSLMWMSDNMENDLATSSEKAAKLRINFLREITHREMESTVVPQLIEQRKLNDENYVLAFIQLIRLNKKQPYKPYFTSTKISKKYNCLICHSTLFQNLENEVRSYSKIININPNHTRDFVKYQSLTRREKEIFELIALGETNDSISELLSISSLTVKTHRQNINRKLDTNKLSQIIKLARRFNVI